MERHKVIFIANGIFPDTVGGVQRHSRLLIEELARHYPLHVYVIHPHPKKVFDDRLTNITEIRVKGIDNSRAYLLELYKFSKRVYFEVSKLDPGIPIYCQGLSLFYNLKKLRNRIVFNPHGLEPYQATPISEFLKLTPFRIYTSIIMHYSGKVISLGGKLSDIVRRNILKGSKVVVIPNAVNPPGQNFTAVKFQTPKLNCLFVSRFAYNKGIDILMKAIQRLNEEGYEDKIQFNLGGSGPLFEYYSTRYNFSNVKFLGFVADDALFELYRDNDLFIFPTQFEGMPTVVLEAMSFAMPIIVTNVGATAELVDMNNGILLHNKRSIVEFKNAILTFYHLDKTKKIAMAESSYDKILSRFTWKKVAADTYSLLTKEIF